MKKMRKVSIYLMLLTIVALFSNCGEKYRFKHLKEPDPSFVFFSATDSSKTGVTDITVSDEIIFKTANADGADYYTLFTGNSSDNVYIRKDTIQANFGIGKNLAKTDGFFRSPKIQFKTPGKYRIYMIATTVDLKSGRKKTAIDSGTVITVTNPNATKAFITSLKITKANGNDKHESRPHSAAGEKANILPFNSTVTNDSIIFNNMKVEYQDYFMSCLFEIQSSNNDSIFINDTLLITGNETVRPKDKKGNDMYSNFIQNGSKITVYAKEGGASKTYYVGIHFYQAPASNNANVKTLEIGSQSSESFKFKWSSKVLVNAKTQTYSYLDPKINSVTIPSLPKGISKFSLTVTTYDKDATVDMPLSDINVSDLPYTFTVNAPDGVTVKEYSLLNGNLPESDATLDRIEILNDAGTYHMVKTGNLYSIQTDSLSLTSFKVKYYLKNDVNNYGWFWYVNKPYVPNNKVVNGDGFNCYGKTVPLFIVVGKDIDTVYFKGIDWNKQ